MSKLSATPDAAPSTPVWCEQLEMTASPARTGANLAELLESAEQSISGRCDE
jgi:hypothetical protein